MLFNAAKLALFAFVGLAIAAPAPVPAPVPVPEEAAVAAVASADVVAAPAEVKAVDSSQNGPYGYPGGVYNPGPAYIPQYGNPSPYGVGVGYQPYGYGGGRSYKKE
ncbi:hypothetical protein E2P81_ATG08002 [Venturia nashicola]|uniref:Uncharacterized protein n=1 Tax=Venturia nashicola TaxID=86259 RepID=A0A4Z1P148_9PEZI|nr:hypothetical protein E6O75_ATG08176 [Venturia nashicola]TLD26190.1 hypothetical protein E2P81_ATG08002 [Venturia nashicola]